MMTALSARNISEIVPRPSAAIERLAEAVMRVVTAQWKRYVAEVFEDGTEARAVVCAPKMRVAAIMYARGCYSMAILGRAAPLPVRTAVFVSGLLPLSPHFAARAGSLTFSALPFLIPKQLHRRIVLVSILMAVLDEIVDEYAPKQGDASAVFDSTTMRTVIPALREGESTWQCEYWNSVLMPAMLRFAREEQDAVAGKFDAELLGHRGAGIDAALKSMWYAVGQFIGVEPSCDANGRARWNATQQWMENGTLLVQMMDDWIDRDRDATTRPTPVTQGQWTMSDIQAQYHKTREDLKAVLYEQGIKSIALHEVVCALYAEYLYRAMRAMEHAGD
jgi:hypothetical protein